MIMALPAEVPLSGGLLLHLSLLELRSNLDIFFSAVRSQGRGHMLVKVALSLNPN